MDFFGKQVQERLSDIKVAVVGAGGTGTPVLLQLAGLGIKDIKIIDNDIISLNNLNRQMLYDITDTGLTKTEVFVKKYNIYDKTSVKPIKEYINKQNIQQILNDREFIFDCTDNFKSKFLLNDYCVNKDKILIHSGVNKERGQVMIIQGNKGISLRHLINDIPEEVENINIVTCATIIAGIQVNEFLNFIINRKTSGIIFVTMFPELNIKIIKP